MTLPIGSEIRVFAPATVANLGPGFDVLGLAVAEPGDTVVARVVSSSGVTLKAVHGDGGALPVDAATNTAGIAAREVLARAGIEAGIELELFKGMPIGSGLGSSAASAAAAALATNVLLGSPLRKTELVEPCMEAEAAVAGRHADNVAPALLGGLILVRSTDPLDLIRLPVPEGLTVSVATPAFSLPTREAREALPDRVALPEMVANNANVAGMISAFHSGDFGLLARSMVDNIVTPARAPLIPGCLGVIQAAHDAGALGSSISGAGPSVFALCRSARNANEVGTAMRDAFNKAGLDATFVIGSADSPGARKV
ncbi:MAG: homoserine kinase [bacterium]|nr:homoserine kinase [bacterium]